MKRLLALAILAALVGCGKSPSNDAAASKKPTPVAKKPTLQLMIGETTIDVAVPDDPKQLQDDLVARVKPLWDGLKSGESVAFSYRFEAMPKIWSKKSFEQKEGQMTVHIEMSPLAFTKRRTEAVFYKNRDGKSGIVFGGEQTDLGSKDEAVTWAQVDAELRRTFFSLDGFYLLYHKVNR